MSTILKVLLLPPIANSVMDNRTLLVFDPGDGAVITAGQTHHLCTHPDSLTKLMTLHLLFEALEDGRLTHQSRPTVFPARLCSRSN